MPPQALNPLSFDEHRELGRDILRTRAHMRQLAALMMTVYGPQSRTTFTYQKVNEAIDRLCGEMQAQAELDCPGLDASSFYR
jgi:hypothetical protein